MNYLQDVIMDDLDVPTFDLPLPVFEDLFEFVFIDHLDVPTFDLPLPDFDILLPSSDLFEWQHTEVNNTNSKDIRGVD